MTAVLIQLGEEVVPEIFEALSDSGLTDLCNIERATETKDSGGALVVSRAVEHEEIPCLYKPRDRAFESEVGGKMVSLVEYAVKLPRHYAGVLIDIKPNDLLTVQARSNEPAKTFKALGNAIVLGVYQRVICNLEN